MENRLASEGGKDLQALRQQTVQPVFGRIKSNPGLSRFPRPAAYHSMQSRLSETARTGLLRQTPFLLGSLRQTRGIHCFR